MTSFGYQRKPIRKNPDYCADPVIPEQSPQTQHNMEEEGAQTHVHEFLGSTRIAEEEEDPHNHRFAGVTSQEIRIPGGTHRHSFLVNTDFYEEHLHEISGLTGPAIFVGEGRHVHFAEVITTLNDGHYHIAIFATLIEDPVGD